MRFPGYPDAPKLSIAKPAMCSPMAKDDVAPGDGAFNTWIASRPWMMLKSSNNEPSLATAWARTPEPPLSRSETPAKKTQSGRFSP